MEFESRGQNALAPPAVAPLSNSPNSATIHNLTNDELNRLLNFEGCSFDLEMPMPDIFGDGDGNELLELEFPGIPPIQPQSTLPNHDKINQNTPPVASAEAEAARNVLASLATAPIGAMAVATAPALDPGSPGPATSNGIDPGLHPSLSTSPHPIQYNTLHHSHSGGPFFPTVALAPPLPVTATHTMSSLPLSHHSIPIYVDSQTGQMYQVAPQAHQWNQGQIGSYPHPMNSGGIGQLQTVHSWPPAGGIGHPSQGLVNGSHVHHSSLQHQHSGMNGIPPGIPPGALMTMPSGSVHFMGSMPSGIPMMMGGPTAPSVMQPAVHAETPSSRKGPNKRRRASKANNETMSQRSAKAEQGYTYE